MMTDGVEAKPHDLAVPIDSWEQFQRADFDFFAVFPSRFGDPGFPVMSSGIARGLEESVVQGFIDEGRMYGVIKWVPGMDIAARAGWTD